VEQQLEEVEEKLKASNKNNDKRFTFSELLHDDEAEDMFGRRESIPVIEEEEDFQEEQSNLERLESVKSLENDFESADDEVAFLLVSKNIYSTSLNKAVRVQLHLI
jgi:hypothetical protein